MSSDVPTRDAIVATARESIERGSKSFSLASRLFDRRTRERAWLLYAWCRACDDLADGQDHGGALYAVADPAARIAAIRSLTDRALAGKWVGVAAFDGLRLLCAVVPLVFSATVLRFRSARVPEPVAARAGDQRIE